MTDHWIIKKRHENRVSALNEPRFTLTIIVITVLLGVLYLFSPSVGSLVFLALPYTIWLGGPYVINALPEKVGTIIEILISILTPCLLAMYLSKDTVELQFDELLSPWKWAFIGFVGYLAYGVARSELPKSAYRYRGYFGASVALFLIMILGEGGRIYDDYDNSQPTAEEIRARREAGKAAILYVAYVIAAYSMMFIADLRGRRKVDEEIAQLKAAEEK